MIPKIIHYCWFGGKPKPQEVLDYIKTWKKYLPDYEIKEWNETNFDIKARRYTYEAYQMKKYAFVSDVCRLEVLAKFGGLYFDTDVEVVSDFHKYEQLTSFVGYEVEDLIGTGVIGAEKNALWIKKFLAIYDNRDFILPNGELDFTPNTISITRFLKELPEELCPAIFPLDVFCAMHWNTHQEMRTDNTVSIHHYRSSWKNSYVMPLERVERKLCRVLHIRNRHLMMRVYKKVVFG